MSLLTYTLLLFFAEGPPAPQFPFATLPAPVPKFKPLSYEDMLPIALAERKPFVVGVRCDPPRGDWCSVRSDAAWAEWGDGAFLLIFTPKAGAMRLLDTVAPATTAKQITALLTNMPAPRVPPPPVPPSPKMTIATPLPRGWHRHVCPYCGYVWAHSTASHGNLRAHTCESCNNVLPHPWTAYP